MRGIDGVAHQAIGPRTSSWIAVIILSLAVVLPSTNATAISRYTSTSMSCSAIKAAIRNQGAVIFRWTSPRTGNPIYNRYVRNENYCNVNQTTRSTYIPASNTTNCRVFYCVKRERNCLFPWDDDC